MLLRLRCAVLFLRSPKTACRFHCPRPSKWEMKYNPDSCQLLASFGGGDQRVIFILTREQPGDSFDLEFFGKLLDYTGIGVPMEVTFGSGPPSKHDGVAMTRGKERLAVIRIANVRIDGWHGKGNYEARPTITPAMEAAVTSITFKKAGGKQYRFETGSMAVPLSAMRTCTADLIKTWGYDPAVEDKLTQPAQPVGSPAKWLRSDDYPVGSLTQGHNGLVRFRMDVDPSGQSTGCRVLYRTNPDEFADLSCKLLMQRARFTPALDAAGKPIKSYYINSIRWMAGEDW
jgi:hypothetical protein